MTGKIRIKDIENIVKSMEVDEALKYLEEAGQQSGLCLDRLILKYRKLKAARDEEIERFSKMCSYENMLYNDGIELIAGVDEAGRGPLAGPVVAAAVILPKDIFIEKLNDSKKLTAKQRDALFDIIRKKAVSYGIGIVDEKCIDEINIINATKKAMDIAISKLNPQPQTVLFDAIELDNLKIPQISIVKGDQKSISIAAASILAKVTRDRILVEMDSIYPQYGFSKHKGYGTGEHISAIKKYGICPIHRVSYTKNFTA
ncbi:MAG TPA: ribonuclease HII [Clostridiaceae bacterium]|nr:ribonuclease HII [Clostridiaceae bacterium]